jgi:DNA-binding NarL/FixJ family response regulator
MGRLQRRDDGLLLELSPEELQRIEAMAVLLGMNALTDDSVGAVMGRPVRIAVLDASLLVRQFWLLLTTVAPSWDLVAAAASVEDLQAQLAADDHPGADVVLANPTGLCSRCLITCQATPETCPLIGKDQLLATLPPVLLHLREGDIQLAGRAMAAGVRGFQLHGSGLMALRDAVLAVVRGGIWIDPELSRDLKAILPSPPGSSSVARERAMASLLSAREQEVLLCLERGATVAVAARQLLLSENTVKTHLRRIYDKLNVRCQRDALAVARLTGLLPQEGRLPSPPSHAAAAAVQSDGQASPPP